MVDDDPCPNCGPHTIGEHQKVTRYQPTLARSRGRLRSTIRPYSAVEHCNVTGCGCKGPRHA